MFGGMLFNLVKAVKSVMDSFWCKLSITDKTPFRIFTMAF